MQKKRTNKGVEASQKQLFEVVPVMVWDCPITGVVPQDWICPVSVVT